MAFVYAEQASWNSRKSVALTVAVAVNVGFLAAMQSGLVFEAVEPKAPMTVVDVAPKTIERRPEPLPAPGRFTPVISFPDRPPILHLPEIDVEPPPVLTPPVLHGGASGSAGVPFPEPELTELKAVHPMTPPDYPPTSIRRAEEGTVRLLIYVLPDGRVGDVKVDRSSGFPRLDNAAVAAARKYWTFKPAAQGGTPIAAWGYFAVTFTLQD